VKNRGGANGDLMLHIVAIWRYPLNAHFCRCLAHFYRVLEKVNEIAHTAWVGNRLWSKKK
jgi:hypothetical protein